MSKWAWALTAEVFGVTALVMGDAAAFWSMNNPSIMTVRAFRRKDGAEADATAKDIRIGGAVASFWIVLVGIGGSAVTKSWWPFVGALGAGAVQWTLWEWAIQNPRGRHGIADKQNLGFGGLGIVKSHSP